MQHTLLLLSLLLSPLLAYQADGLQPIVRTYVNFGLNPFIVDPFDPEGYSELTGYNGLANVGNVFNSTNANPGIYMSNQAFPVPGLGSEVTIDGTMAFQAEFLSGVIQSPLGIDADPLYGCGQFGIFDPTQGWIFSHILTNTRIYAYYARLPIAQTTANDYLAFAYLVPIADRTLFASNQLSVVLNKAHFTVSFRVQNVERLFIERVGGPIDPRFEVVPEEGTYQCKGFPDTFHVIFGTGLLKESFQHPHIVCQAPEVFDQCYETIQNADRVLCDYQPEQNKDSYSTGLTLTVEHWDVIEWSPFFDCLDPAAIDVAMPNPEGLCFGNCPGIPVIIPNPFGCGITPNRCPCSASERESDIINSFDCPIIWKECSVSTASEDEIPDECHIVYRPVKPWRDQTCRPHQPSSSSHHARRHRSRKPCRGQKPATRHHARKPRKAAPSASEEPIITGHRVHQRGPQAFRASPYGKMMKDSIKIEESELDMIELAI